MIPNQYLIPLSNKIFEFGIIWKKVPLQCQMNNPRRELKKPAGDDLVYYNSIFVRHEIDIEKIKNKTQRRPGLLLKFCNRYYSFY